MMAHRYTVKRVGVIMLPCLTPVRMCYVLYMLMVIANKQLGLFIMKIDEIFLDPQ